MKRSNLFLGLTTGLLAVATIGFAKFHRSKGAFTGCCITARRIDNIKIDPTFRYTATADSVVCLVNSKVGAMRAWPNCVALVTTRIN